MKIEWLISGIDPRWEEKNYRDGGAVYESYVRNALKSKYEIKNIYLSRGGHRLKIIKACQFGRYILKNACMKFQGEIVIRDLFSTVFARFDRRRKNVVIIHHLDISLVKNKSLYKWIMRRFFERVRLADIVVVVSEYWKNIWENSGCSNVHVIYNSFDLNSFNFNLLELSSLQEKLGINREKPLIYLGNARPEKGFIETYKVLKDIDAIFVVTGRHKINLPILQYYLSYSEYLKLLKISSLVITMSKFDEGWCRTAHEAMLCGTPVVGSGRGGMRELLERGGQIICKDFSQLKPVVIDLLNNREKLRIMGGKGKEFAKNFTLDNFKKSWIYLIETLAMESDRVKVLHLTHNVELFGISTFLFHLLQAQKQYRDIHSVIAFNKGHKNIHKFREMGIAVHGLPSSSARNVKLLISFLKLFKHYDIINLHTYSPWALLAAILLRKRIIYTFHGAFGLKGRWTDSIKKQFYRSIINRFANRIVFASQTSLSIYQHRIGCELPREKVELFPFGLQIESIKSKKSRDEIRTYLGINNKFVVGTVARIDVAKKIERLLESFSFLPREDNFRLLIVGSGDNDYLNKLSAQVQNERLENSVTFLGYREDVFDIVNALDLFVLPSTKETFGLALLEAMALGIPSAIFNDAGGALDIIGDSGFVVETSEQLCSIMLRLKNDNNLREAVSRRVRERSQLFDIKYTAEKFHQIYQELR